MTLHDRIKSALMVHLISLPNATIICRVGKPMTTKISGPFDLDAMVDRLESELKGFQQSD